MNYTTPKPVFDFDGKRVFVAGHRGLAGSAIVRRLAQENCEVLTADRSTLDLTDQRATETWLERERPDAIFLAAGLVGGIHANNTYPADFIAKNVAIALNVHTRRPCDRCQKITRSGIVVHLSKVR
jgi:GDP-L-fucose synthase